MCFLWVQTAKCNSVKKLIAKRYHSLKTIGLIYHGIRAWLIMYLIWE